MVLLIGFGWKDSKMLDLKNIEMVMLDGRETTLAEWLDKVVLVVNVASRCGLTPQYAALEMLQQKYQDRGFTVLGFPSNQFLQEMGTNDSIAEYCSMTWGVSFPMSQKVRVNGTQKHPLYAQLRNVSDAAGYSGRIRWNFEKFLILPNGTVQRFAPTVKPDETDIIGSIENALTGLGR